MICVFCEMSCLSHAQGTAELYKDCSSCFDVFSAEFDESKIACSVSADKCKCQLKVLDLSACVIDYISGTEKPFDLVVNGSSSDTAASKYTAACKENVEKHGPCKLDGIFDRGFQVTANEIALTASAILFELMSAYQMVCICFRLFSPRVCTTP